MSTLDASVTVDATTGIIWSPAHRNHPIPAPKIGSSTATPHKTLLQIMFPAGHLQALLDNPSNSNPIIEILRPMHPAVQARRQR